MKKTQGFSLVELILAMCVAGVFLFLLGSMTRHMVSVVDGEQEMMTVEQHAKKIHEYVARLMRDASASSIQLGGPCGILRFNTVNFGGGTTSHHWYFLTTAINELYEESDTNCTDGSLITKYLDPASMQLSLTGNIFEWTMLLKDGVDSVPVRIVTSPRNL